MRHVTSVVSGQPELTAGVIISGPKSGRYKSLFERRTDLSWDLVPNTRCALGAAGTGQQMLTSTRGLPLLA